MKTNKIIKTIVFNNEYKGLKKSQATDSKIIMIQFDSNILKNISDYENLWKSGIYFLIENDENSTKLYIGQAKNLYERLKQHYQNEDMNFNNVICFYSDDNLSKTYYDYLEYYYINQISNQDFYIIKNKDKRNIEPKVNEFEYIEIENYVLAIDELLNFIEMDFKSSKNGFCNNGEMFTLNESNLIYKNGIFLLLKGSKLPKEIKEWNNKDTKKTQKRYDALKNFIKTNIEFIKENDSNYELINDLKINSPSFAACLAKGITNANGWNEWKNTTGKSLDDIYRKELN